ncbi:MAG TPA: hypothetical protein VFX49_23080 [Chloroflexota bacterium]|nr:hypothetical protein [Chloroflexota bacterium]
MDRRRLLAGAGALAMGACAAPIPGTGTGDGRSEVYVGLGRAREVAILDAVSDRVQGRISLGAFGDQGAPAQIAVGPSGNAAVIPLVSRAPAVALIQQDEEKKAPQASATPAARNTRRTSWLSLSHGARATATRTGVPLPEAAQRMSADARGNAYVVIADGGALSTPEVAVVELRTGQVRRRLAVGRPGEAILALQADPAGERLCVALWDWGESGLLPPGQQGQLLAVDPRSGAVLGRADLPGAMAVLDLALSAPPPGAGTTGDAALYAVTVTPGPAREEHMYLAQDRRYALVALDPEQLNVLATWQLDAPTSTFAVTGDGTRAYLLSGPSASGPWSRALACLDLSSSGSSLYVRHWRLPDGCFSMTLSPVGKLYVADALGDRLWRFDVRRNAMLGDLPLPGAPLTLASRPT